MRYFLNTLLALCFIFTGTGCTFLEPQPTQDIQEINISDELNLSESQSYDLYDYHGNTLLLSVYDINKRAPDEKETAQANAMYIDKFVLYDIALQKIKTEYPVGRFGLIHSALLYADGALFSFYSPTDTAILYINSDGVQKVCDVEFTPYDLGPLLYRCEDMALFSYQNYTDDLFGLKMINPKLETKSLLTFHSQNADYISDDYRTSLSNYVYTVGENGKVTFYVGTVTTEPIRISLSEGEKINSFALTEDALIVCKEDASSDDGTYFLEKFDFAGNSLEVFKLDMPIVRVHTNNHGELCGFCIDTPITLYETRPQIQHIEKKDIAMIDSTFNSCLSNGENFLIYSHDPSCQLLWILD